MGFWQFATGGGSGGGSGDVVGPASATDNAIARFDGTTGKLIQNSGVTVADGLTGSVVVGSTGATDNAILRADGTGGATAQASVVTIADTTGLMSFPDFALKGGSGELSIRTTNDAQYAAINVFNQNWWSVTGAVRAGIFYQAGKYFGLVSDYQFTWSSSTTESVGPDTGLARSAAGVVKITDGSTGIRCLLGGGTSVASATALPVPTGRVFHVTGTTAITSITSTNFQAGAVITLIFDDVLTFTDGNNLKLAGDFTTSADDTITLAYDGTNWYECSRSVN